MPALRWPLSTWFNHFPGHPLATICGVIHSLILVSNLTGAKSGIAQILGPCGPTKMAFLGRPAQALSFPKFVLGLMDVGDEYMTGESGAQAGSSLGDKETHPGP